MVKIEDLARSVRNIEGLEMDAEISTIVFCMHEYTLKDFLKFYEGKEWFAYEVDNTVAIGLVRADLVVFTYFNGELISEGFPSLTFSMNKETGALVLREEEED